jgi:hypothetical protein
MRSVSAWEAMPLDNAPSASVTETIKPPRCAMCRARMELLSGEPQADGIEKHVFKCPRCEFSKIKTTGDANAARHRPPRKKKLPPA